MGERHPAGDAQLGPALVCAVGAAACRIVELAPVARCGARAGGLSDHRLGAGVGAPVERDRLPSRENIAWQAAPAVREGALELGVVGPVPVRIAQRSRRPPTLLT